ncbi:MAG: hypothetical protein KatS3mg103_0462 [Phycisphaerales bacterium]|nr:MAG: hypothetical protein KatS3mg103_0462 [Phycisphaerales bacterium]
MAGHTTEQHGRGTGGSDNPSRRHDEQAGSPASGPTEAGPTHAGGVGRDGGVGMVGEVGTQPGMGVDGQGPDEPRSEPRSRRGVAAGGWLGEGPVRSLRGKFLLLLALLGLVVAINAGTMLWGVLFLERQIDRPMRAVERALTLLSTIKRSAGAQHNLLSLHVPAAVGPMPEGPGGVHEPQAGQSRAEPGSDAGPGHGSPSVLGVQDGHVRARLDELGVRAVQAAEALRQADGLEVVLGDGVRWYLADRLAQAQAQVRQVQARGDPAERARALALLLDIHERIEGIEAQVVANAALASAHTARMRTLVMASLGATVLLAVLAGVLGVQLVHRWVLRPVAELRSAAERFGSGQLDYRVQVVGRDEIATLAREFNAMAGTIERMQRERIERERLAAFGTATQRIVHNIKSPLAGIRMLAELAGDQRADQARQSLGRIVSTVDRLNAWLKRLLEVGRPGEVHRQRVRPGPWLEGVLGPLADRARGEGVALEVDLSQAPEQARFDAGQLEQAVVALVSNALEACAGGGDGPGVRLDAASRGGPAGVLGPGRLPTPGLGCRRRSAARCSSRTSRPSPRAVASGLQWCRRSRGTTAGMPGCVTPARVPGRCLPWRSRWTRTASMARAGHRWPVWRPAMASILVVEDDQDLRFSIRATLERQGHAVLEAGSVERGLELFQSQAVDLVLTDLRMPGQGGLELIGAVREEGFAGGVLVLTSDDSVATAVEAMKLGADEYLLKPLSVAELTLVVERTLERGRRDARLRLHERLASQPDGEAVSGGPVGSHPAWQHAVELARRLASLPLPGSGQGPLPAVLLLGETGTGKGVLARLLHECSASQGQAPPFVHVNCAALPASLIESELFGHERGAFTDAKAPREGLFEMARGGTIFLDEIGEMPLELQSKLLLVLESGTFRRVGGSRERSACARVVAATNQDLAGRVAQKQFRSDLFYRLNTFTITLPPLRERGQDALEIARDALARFAKRFGRQGLHLGPAAERVILEHDWPGNVRELVNAMQHAAMLSRSDRIEPSDLAIARPASAEPQGLVFDFERGPCTVEAVERALVEQALRHTRGNVTAAARLIRMQRSSIRNRIERYGLHDLVRELSAS